MNFAVEDLPISQVSLGPGQDGLNVVVVQTQSLWRKKQLLFRHQRLTPILSQEGCCGSYLDVGQVDETRERREVVVVQVDTAQVTEQLWWTEIYSPK